MSDHRHMTDDAQRFIRQTHHDAFLHLITKMRADAWADGYTAARRDVEQLDKPGVFQPDHPLYPAVARLNEEAGSDLRNRAYRELLDRQAQAERKAVAALAEFGRSFGVPSS